MLTRAIMIVALLGVAASIGCEKNDDVSGAPESDVEAESGIAQVNNQVVEASCGQCQFEMDGGGCDLAIRVDGETYFVDGSSIDDHGDAHSSHGLCNAIRQARVTGKVVDGRFHADDFELLPAEDE